MTLVKPRSFNIFMLGLASGCVFENCCVCFADETQQQTAQGYGIPAAPVVLLIKAAKHQRKKIWNREIKSIKDVENALRDYIEGISYDCHVHQEYFNEKTEHWLLKLYERNEKIEKGNRKFWTLASKRSFAPRRKLVRFADETSMDKIDRCMETVPPPFHLVDTPWRPRPEDFDLPKWDWDSSPQPPSTKRIPKDVS